MNLIKIKEPMSSKNDAKICLGIDFEPQIQFVR